MGDDDVLTQVDCMNVVDKIIQKIPHQYPGERKFFLLIKQEFCLIFDRNALRYMPM